MIGFWEYTKEFGCGALGSTFLLKFVDHGTLAPTNNLQNILSQENISD